MSQSFQHEKPPARVNLFLEVAKGDATERVELPMRMLVVGDFTNREDGPPLEDREVINLNKDNFEDVLRSQELRVKTAVPNTLTDDDDLAIDLTFDSMKSFNPDQIAKQVPELSRLLATRNLLQDLRNRLISAADFRKQIESVINDPAAREQLLAELDKVIQEDAPSDDAA
ncbi:type VI secretion system-associated protein [Rubrivirga sp. SAORIC476]|uniref:type VI secretion system contractile sheath small subunit n=1 Tax=Rubrivirga sp. SAORIC476 TaxID=1961794 RepID=UPI000BA9BDEC|nr:type VI secretion system contractile sheath small subunit [Rubrivirga sp. SAORIC476]MAQ94412.1 type VI secretion system contractile sheath small subunit [Rhodothermaceae bacterium]MBC11360.1 type VI secretion system contractile sheath small subunit [Rhodothermaceae bacterium]PAP81412.1 type VI secretion system-associated protein [Rubrivirga sp. SAORIC476]|tara:strand:- start:408 stop:920 length:513 start_codon:yes stop_codon:yes gene_type:complete